jgi:DNA-binding SARP family transcriptional activator
LPEHATADFHAPETSEYDGETNMHNGKTVVSDGQDRAAAAMRGSGVNRRPRGVLAVGLLGSFEVSVDGRPVRLTASRQRALLATLAMSAGRTVSVDRLATAVWAADLPGNVRRSVQTYLARLRGALGARWIGTRSGGYVLNAEPDQVDALRFGRLLEAAGAASDIADERTLLTEALDLWRGRPFEGVSSQWLEEAEAPPLLERYLTALERRLDLDIAAGRHGESVAELRELTALYPLRESLWARLLVVLDRCGRQAEALARYETIRVRIADELGAFPGPELQRIHADLLSGRSPQLDLGAGLPMCPRMVPRQLPAAVPDLIGRDDAFAALDDMTGYHGDAGSRPPSICTIHGVAGSGKTTLAVSWGHRVSDRFPDGQLHVDLRGSDPNRPLVDPRAALGRFLRGLGLDPRRVPDDLEERAALFRSVTAGRRLLVVLDDAGTEEQVRPLLPGASTCLVLVTSRHSLTGLVAREGARNVPLTGLTPVVALTFLENLIGSARLAGERDAAVELARVCGFLPQALRAAAGELLTRPGQDIAGLLRELRHHPDDERTPQACR